MIAYLGLFVAPIIVGLLVNVAVELGAIRDVLKEIRDLMEER